MALLKTTIEILIFSGPYFPKLKEEGPVKSQRAVPLQFIRLFAQFTMSAEINKSSLTCFCVNPGFNADGYSTEFRILRIHGKYPLGQAAIGPSSMQCEVRSNASLHTYSLPR